jgi:antitoxin YobK
MGNDQIMAVVDELIEIMEAEGDIAGSQPPDRVERAEAALGFSLPPSFRAFTSAVGSADTRGIEIYGVLSDDFENAGVPDGIWLTLRVRSEYDLPATAIIVAEDGMGGYYVLDTSKADERGEPPVEVWVPGRSDGESPSEVVGRDFASTFLAMVLE